MHPVRLPLFASLQATSQIIFPNTKCANTYCKHRREFGHGLLAAYIDLKKVFDTVHCKSFWKILRLRDIPTRIIGLIASLYTGTDSVVLAPDHRGTVGGTMCLTKGLQCDTGTGPFTCTIRDHHLWLYGYLTCFPQGDPAH
ncbi:uncharacterized protein LOC119568343 [Penaeus monodon]|uniref:uncharacterized protein LOC119568343 n=1 Tax=Penaeus monodon TaxID=6687 RepID=UPI0018A7BFBF|nr:uncharacterized protein LOC119568343 [Penaeus monodon]